jgi:hypothetical protein
MNEVVINMLRSCQQLSAAVDLNYLLQAARLVMIDGATYDDTYGPRCCIIIVRQTNVSMFDR